MPCNVTLQIATLPLQPTMEERVSEFGKPKPSVGKEQRGEYWVVVTLNADGIPRQERPFRSHAEADAFWLKEVGRVNGQTDK